MKKDFMLASIIIATVVWLGVMFIIQDYIKKDKMQEALRTGDYSACRITSVWLEYTTYRCWYVQVNTKNHD